MLCKRLMNNQFEQINNKTNSIKDISKDKSYSKRYIIILGYYIIMHIW